MELFETINAVVVSMGIPAIIGAAIYIGRKLQILDNVEDDIKFLKQDIHGIHQEIREIKSDCGKIWKKIYNHDSRINGIKMMVDKTMFISNSPIRMTDFSKRLLVASGLKEIIDGNLKPFIDTLYRDNPASPFDVQQSSLILMLKEIETDRFIKVRDFLYQNPEFEDHAITIASVAMLGSVYLRDEYFKVHPELLKK